MSGTPTNNFPDVIHRGIRTFPDWKAQFPDSRIERVEVSEVVFPPKMLF
jgi:hypothetical protein